MLLVDLAVLAGSGALLCGRVVLAPTPVTEYDWVDTIRLVSNSHGVNWINFIFTTPVRFRLSMYCIVQRGMKPLTPKPFYRNL